NHSLTYRVAYTMYVVKNGVYLMFVIIEVNFAMCGRLVIWVLRSVVVCGEYHHVLVYTWRLLSYRSIVMYVVCGYLDVVKGVVVCGV
ncbi:hypothetical protein J6590_065485, partial [Homalodisca vitripennis]